MCDSVCVRMSVCESVCMREREEQVCECVGGIVHAWVSMFV